MAKLTWTVELSVDESWIADGFDLTEERALEMLNTTIPYAYGHELEVKIIKSPKTIKIAKLQGYRTVQEYKASL